MVPTEAVALFPTQNTLKPGDQVVVMSGIGNPKAFVSDVRKRYDVKAKLNFPDHHVYSVPDIERIVALLEKYPQAMLLTTEKDSVKLRRSRRVPDIVRQRLFYQPLKVEFLEGSDEDFLGTLKKDLEGKVHLEA